MSKVITSPVPEYPGTVTLSDPLTFPQAIAFNRGRAKAQASDDQIDTFYQSLIAVMPCVEKWDIQGLPPEKQTPDTFPVYPINTTSALIGWIVHEVITLLFRPADIPNESGPKPTDT